MSFWPPTASPAVEVPDFEADDVIGTLSDLAAHAGHEVLMVTPDKDYGQLVTEHVRMYRPMQGGGLRDLGRSRDTGEVRPRLSRASH